ncbi:MAG: hypothetical protein DI551_05260 [Micavibrio aeruginosavorus]|uniref:Uncharacterized protein n=1 Tax=Micavibrio aeruginosavorus TaxID=349221 RepID=A0A2W5MZS7_9BACT|nr:MAG: hypothetical protein DI551_05260 [Micavibrio aeruginosavorus]
MDNREASTAGEDAPSGDFNTQTAEVVPFPELPRHSNLVFDGAVRALFLHEGLYSNDSNDPGGPTKYGWSLRTAKLLGDLDGDGHLDFDFNDDGKVDIRDVRMMSAPQAMDLFFKVFWLREYDLLPPSVAQKIFNLSVNMGKKQAHIILQRGIRACSSKVLKEDGVIGALTLQAAQGCYAPSLLSAVRSEAGGFYRQLVLTRPTSKKYINGWLNRAYY